MNKEKLMNKIYLIDNFDLLSELDQEKEKNEINFNFMISITN